MKNSHRETVINIWSSEKDASIDTNMRSVRNYLRKQGFTWEGWQPSDDDVKEDEAKTIEDKRDFSGWRFTIPRSHIRIRKKDRAQLTKEQKEKLLRNLTRKEKGGQDKNE